MWELNHKEVECRRTDAFELWCWRRLSRVPWTARRSNQSILNQISPEYSLDGLTLKLKLQYFDLLMWSDLLEKILKARKGWREEKGTTEDETIGWHHWLSGHEFEKLWELVMDREAWRTKVHGVAKSWTWLSYWTATILSYILSNFISSFSVFMLLIFCVCLTALASTSTTILKDHLLSLFFFFFGQAAWLVGS